MKFLRYLIENFWDFDPSDLIASEDNSLTKYENITPQKLQQLSDEELDKVYNSARVEQDLYRRRDQQSLEGLTRILKTNVHSPDLMIFSGGMYSTPPPPIAPGFKRNFILRFGSSIVDVREGSKLGDLVVMLIKQMEDFSVKSARWNQAIEIARNERSDRIIALRKIAANERAKAAKEELVKKQQHVQTIGSLSNPKILEFKPSPRKKRGEALFEIDNPYYEDRSANNKDQYVGHPANFQNWTSSLVVIYSRLDEILKRNGKPPLSKMYAGRKRQNNISFVVVANDNFVWLTSSYGPRTYFLYVNGLRMKLSRFLMFSDVQQDGMVADV